MSTFRDRRLATRVVGPRRLFKSGADKLRGPRNGSQERQGLFIDFTTQSVVVWDDATQANRKLSLQEGKTVLNSLLTYTAPSAKIVRGQNGLLFSSSGSLPFSWDAKGNCEGVLVEEQRTNLATYSEAFDNAAWTKTNLAVTADQTAAPDGTTTADLVTASVSSASTILYYGPQTVTPSASYTWSVFVKKGTQRYIGLCLQGATSAIYIAAVFDLDGGGTAATETSVGATSGTVLSTSQVAYSNGWFRLTLSATSSDSNYYPWVAFAQAATGNSFDANTGQLAYSKAGTETFYAWGAQFEAGSFPTSYIPTPAGSTVTRAADQIGIATSGFSFNASATTLFAQFRQVSAASKLCTFVSMNDNTFNNNSINIFQSDSPISAAGTRITAFMSAGGATVVDMNLAAASTNTMKAALAAEANNAAGTVDGAAVTTDTSLSMPSSIDALWVGGREGSLTATAFIEKIIYIPRRLSNSELQTLTS